MSKIDICQPKRKEKLIIKEIVSPSPRYAKIIPKLLAHFGHPWVENIERRVRGDFVEWSRDYFFLGEINNELIANVWYTVPQDARGIGLLGHVFTKPEHRKKGIATHLTEIALERFSQEKGKVMYLFFENTAAHKIYKKLGFREYNGKIMRYLSANIFPSNFDESYFFHEGETVANETNWGDLPRFQALYAFPHLITVKDYNYRIFTGEELEGKFIEMMNDQEEGKSSLGALRNSRGVVVGAVSLVKLSGCEERIGNLDFFIHPHYLSQADKLLCFSLKKAKEKSLQLIRVYLSSLDVEKIDIVRNLGFLREATLRDQFQYQGEKYNLLIFTKKV